MHVVPLIVLQIAFITSANLRCPKCYKLYSVLQNQILCGHQTAKINKYTEMKYQTTTFSRMNNHLIETNEHILQTMKTSCPTTKPTRIQVNNAINRKNRILKIQTVKVFIRRTENKNTTNYKESEITNRFY